MRLTLLLAFFFSTATSLGQELENTWISETSSSSSIAELRLENGRFSYDLKTQDSITYSGDYLKQDQLLVFFHSSPTDSISRFRIDTLSAASLILRDGTQELPFNAASGLPLVDAPAESLESPSIVPSQGFSLESLWRGVLGMISLLLLAFLFSSNRRAINWRTVGLGLAFQLIIAIGVLKVPFIESIFDFVGSIFVKVLEFTLAGSDFLFQGLVSDTSTFGYIFAFQVLPTILFFSALTSVLYYFGIIQKVVKAFGWLLSRLLKISGAESLSVAGNIFLGQTEAPLLIKAYLEKMNKSEILLVMIGGMATVAGAVLAAYIGFLGGDDPALRLVFAKHLLAASVMAAPGAIVISKILYPQTEEVNTDVKVSSDKIGANVLDAIANGTTEGLRLAVNVGAMLLVFVAFIAMVNGILNGIASFDGITISSMNIQWEFTSLNTVIAEHTDYDSLSLEFILGYTFAPLMWLIGVAEEDMMMMGQLLGIKLAASEFVGYIQLADLKNTANAVHLNYEKSIIMATYMLCGFANFASIGIQIGGIGSLAPGQRTQLSRFGLKALIGGSIASLISATIAGMIIG
ncbi:NupC/NupG family nucleoside CNT transporter [Croceiramulus getboli]|nr:nucleoside transporter C-terminal domain-containing protein [Flavobacteriaceae bacterium YJPT1-3]